MTPGADPPEIRPKVQVSVTHLGPMQRLFDTTSISLTQWMVCAAVASSVLWVEEARKFTVRRTNRMEPLS